MKLLLLIGLLAVAARAVVVPDATPDASWIDRVLEQLKSALQREEWRVNKSAVCSACITGVTSVRLSLRLGVSVEHIADIIEGSCVRVQAFTPRVCKGAKKTYLITALNLLKKSPYSTADLCYLLLPYCPQPHKSKLRWRIPLPGGKPTPQPPPLPLPNAPKMRILHLSDIHVDPMYREGSDAVCKEPLCCRANDEGAESAHVEKAGKWGYAGACDLPMRTVEALLRDASERQRSEGKYAYVYWTGDIPPHDVWNQSRGEQLHLERAVDTLLKKYFPDTPIVAALGNHESYPANMFPQPFIHGRQSLQWLYNDTAELWSKLLPSLNATERAEILYGGYYAFRPFEGLRVIVVNNNYCYNLNFWLMLNASDVAHSLHWLVAQLDEAEKMGEHVHIVSHIPATCGDCIRVWQENYYRITARYENTIRAHFYGHTHFDSFTVMYDPDNLKRPTSIVYTAPSATTFASLNPGYRIYTVDGQYVNSSHQVLDHATHTLNVTAANERDDASQWRHEYSARAAYALPSLRPHDWSALIKRAERHDATLEQYVRYHYKEERASVAACGAKCKHSLLCTMKGNSC